MIRLLTVLSSNYIGNELIIIWLDYLSSFRQILMIESNNIFDSSVDLLISGPKEPRIEWFLTIGFGSKWRKTSAVSLLNRQT